MKILDKRKQILLGHLQPGASFVWAQYKSPEELLIVTNRTLTKEGIRCVLVVCLATGTILWRSLDLVVIPVKTTVMVE